MDNAREFFRSADGQVLFGAIVAGVLAKRSIGEIAIAAGVATVGARAIRGLSGPRLVALPSIPAG